ncbi:hypothetical protein F7734_23125 [Scytonema sp. UIC 10036]|uniref:hypothetical protein n=1 Tax=Scytonema sp. UIC 10036 TaxID=2304196 RepID=UPI0012DA4C23|nr:hypothetical protein [Scytonema sp. UIC 10036]MUG95096.1 hypothetical protein [Scytonema sp. UIC 10036]
MQAYKLQAIVDESGNLILDEPLNMTPGKVEVIILQPTPTTTKTSEQPKKREYKVQALKDLLENAPPTPPDFDAEQAKWEYLKEKHNL